MDKYVKIDKVGEGAYGIVFKGKNKTTGELVAIKKVRMDDEDDGIPSTSIREISLLKELEHPNIVGLKEVLAYERRLFLIFEFLQMDLKIFLDTYKSGKFLEPMLVKSYTYQISQAMLYCHRRRVLHRDLKPQNLLIGSNGLIKVADFGLGRAFGIPIRVYTHEVVTLWYRAPEVLLGSLRYSCPVDIWSIGCIMAELVNRKPLFQGDSEIDQLFKIFRILSTPSEDSWAGVSVLPDYKATFPNWTNNLLETHVKRLEKSGIELLQMMLVYNPRIRISAKEVVNHEYFQDLDFSQLPIYYD